MLKIGGTQLNGDLNDYHKLFDAISTMVFVITCSGVILAVNSEVIKKTGYCKDELLGVNILSLHPKGSEDEIHRVLSALQDSSESLCTLPIVSKSGKWIDAETRIYRGTWEGDQVLFGFSTDVTLQRITEYKCRAIFQNSPIPIVVSSTYDGTVLEVNDAWCKLLGFNKEDVVSKNTVSLGIWESLDNRSILISKLKSEGKIDGEEIIFYNSDGDRIYGLIYGVKYILNGEEVWITSFIDKTKQYLLEEKMDIVREIALTAAVEDLAQQLSSNTYIR